MTKWVNQTAGGVAGFTVTPWQINEWVGSSDYDVACPYVIGDLNDTGIGWQLDGTVVNYTYRYPVTLDLGSSPQNDYVVEVKIKTPASGVYNSEFALLARCYDYVSDSYQLQFGVGAIFRFNYAGSGVIETRNVLNTFDGLLVQAGDDSTFNTFGLSANTEYSLRIEVKGNEIRSYVDGVLSKTNTWSGTTELDGLLLARFQGHFWYTDDIPPSAPGLGAPGSHMNPTVTSLVVSDEFYSWATPGSSDGSLLMSL